MRHRDLVLVSALVAAVSLTGVPTAGQTSWTPPLTPWGDPDLEGVFRAREQIHFERPAQYAGREFLTDKEVAEQEAGLWERNVRTGKGLQTSLGFRQQANYNAVVRWSPERPRVARRTSAIIDPPDGRLPPWTLEMVKVYEEREAVTLERGEADWTIDRHTPERCLPAIKLAWVPNWGLGLGSGEIERSLARGADGDAAFNLGGTINTQNPLRRLAWFSPMRIMQAPGYVVIQKPREPGQIIPLDGRPRLPKTFEQYLGDARGRWEGNTLVVEYTNIKDVGPVIYSYTHGLHPSAKGDTLRIIERYTRVSPDTVEYSYTVDDPLVYTSPWTAQHNLTLDNDYTLAPEICREGITAMGTILFGWRLDEQTAINNAAEARKARKPWLEEAKRRAIAEAERRRLEGSGR